MSVEEVFERTFNVPLNSLSDATSKDAIPEWDSMGHITLIMELETVFGVSISLDDSMEMVTVGNVKDVLKRYGITDQ
jgi:acyl carrier protein